MDQDPSLIISCEHGGNQIPEEFQDLFVSAEAVLESHRGFDIGALSLAQKLARETKAPLVGAEISRLLIDLNRTLKQQTLFSEFTQQLPVADQQQIIDLYYRPYQNQIRWEISQLIAKKGKVFHLSVHSFTPALNGEIRNADIGLLYDPSSPSAVNFCLHWQRALQVGSPDLRVRRNYPYHYRAAGALIQLQREFDPAEYAVIALEVNQALPLENSDLWAAIQRILIDTFRQTLAESC